MDRIKGIIYRGSEEYNHQFQTYNSRVDASPKGFYKPSSIDELSLFVKTANQCGERVVVRSGGHSCAGLSTANDVFIIDMRALNRVNVNTESRWADVEAGATMSEIYNTICPFGFVVPGGGCPSVCIGGIITGGGANILSQTFGYMCDNVLEMTVVVADGTIVKCTTPLSLEHGGMDHGNADLAWAMCGGGHCGFGVLASIRLKLSNMEPVYYFNMITLPGDKWNSYFKLTLEVLLNYFETVQPNINLSLNTRRKYISSEKGYEMKLNIYYFYVGDPVIGKVLFQDLFNLISSVHAIPVQQPNMDKDPVTFLSLINTGPLVKPKRQFTRCRIVNNLTKEQITQVQSFFEIIPEFDIDHDKEMLITLDFWSQGGKTNTLPTDYNAMYHRNGLWTMSLNCTYTNPNNDEIMNTWSKQVGKIMATMSKFIYQNYPEDDLEDWKYAYYGDNVTKLEHIKKKYDPNRYFNYTQSL